MPSAGGAGLLAGAAGAAGALSGSGGIMLQLAGSGGISAGSSSVCAGPMGSDQDLDGFTGADGDCNDCDAATNPGAFDVPDNQIDEDCSGTADDEPSDCDQGLPVDGDALAAAKALGLCRATSAGAQGKQRSWGVISAAYVFPDGSSKTLDDVQVDPCTPDGAPHPVSHGLLERFGPNVKPPHGSALVALSSGAAREGQYLVGDLSGLSPLGGRMCTLSLPPEGFPASSYATCGDVIPGSTSTYNGMALELSIRAPTNANAFSFDFDFYTSEYTHWVCSGFNDGFVALLYSSHADVPANHNIAFDSQQNPVSVNNAFVEVCQPYVYVGGKGGQPFERPFNCPLGTSELDGTGFEDHAATGWLRTNANIVPGEELTLRFAIWDTADQILDSTVLLDRFVWSVAPGSVVTERPPLVK